MANDEKILVAIAELKGKIDGLDKDVKALQRSGEDTRESIESLRSDMNGRFKKLEHTVFGNEEADKVGLVEKVRRFDDVTEIIVGDEKKGLLPLVERVRHLESGWAKLTAVAVLACSIVVEAVKYGIGYLYSAAQTGGKPHP
jgi:hypothetical protein